MSAKTMDKEPSDPSIAGCLLFIIIIALNWQRIYCQIASGRTSRIFIQEILPLSVID